MNGRSAQKVRMRGKTLVETIVPSLDDIVRTVQIIPDDTPGGGLTMRISLPIADGQPKQGAAP